MIETELLELIEKVTTMKTEFQTIELKAANDIWKGRITCIGHSPIFINKL